MSEAEVVKVEQWATDVWSQLRASEPSASPAAACPDAREGLAMVREYALGFCLLVPADYTVFQPDPHEIAIMRESLLNDQKQRVYIHVTDAAGRTADAVADEVVASLEGFEIARRAEAVAGQQAALLDNLPGQDLSRRLLWVANGLLYYLTFAPLDHEEMEQFYATIMGDLTLIQPE
jgi:hypothetical protein